MSPSGAKVWIITGCNNGFGLRLAKIAAKAGFNVVGTVRSLSKFPQELADLGVHPLEIELTASEAVIVKAVQSVATEYGHIDVLINNAGFAHVGSIEETTDDEMKAQFDVNVFGLAKFMRAVLPTMRSQNSGLIVNLSSIGGLVSSEGGAVYCASKFAVEALTEALREEVKKFGIRVHLVEPGYFRTNFIGYQGSGGSSLSRRIDTYPDYNQFYGSQDGQQPGDPEKGMQRVYELITLTGSAANFEDRLRLILGSDAYADSLAKVESLRQNIEACKEIAHSTDFK